MLHTQKDKVDSQENKTDEPVELRLATLGDLMDVEKRGHFYHNNIRPFLMLPYCPNVYNWQKPLEVRSVSKVFQQSYDAYIKDTSESFTELMDLKFVRFGTMFWLTKNSSADKNAHKVAEIEDQLSKIDKALIERVIPELNTAQECREAIRSQTVAINDARVQEKFFDQCKKFLAEFTVHELGRLGLIAGTQTTEASSLAWKFVGFSKFQAWSLPTSTGAPGNKVFLGEDMSATTVGLITRAEPAEGCSEDLRKFPVNENVHKALDSEYERRAGDLQKLLARVLTTYPTSGAAPSDYDYFELKKSFVHEVKHAPTPLDLIKSVPAVARKLSFDLFKGFAMKEVVMEFSFPGSNLGGTMPVSLSPSTPADLSPSDPNRWVLENLALEEVMFDSPDDPSLTNGFVVHFRHYFFGTSGSADALKKLVREMWMDVLKHRGPEFYKLFMEQVMRKLRGGGVSQ